MKKSIQSEKGEGYIDMVIIILVAMMLIALAVNVYPVFIVKQQLNTYVNDVARIVEVEGCYNQSVKDQIETYETQTKFKPKSMDVQANWIDGVAKKVQIGDTITISGILDYKLKLLWFEANIPLSSTAHGKSEVYWK